MKKIAVVAMVLALTLSGSAAFAQEKAEIESKKALAFLVDIEKTPGWMVYLEGGYQWNFFRGVGMKHDGNRLYKQNYTKGGAAGAIALGYNFCPKFPLTLGMKIGTGPSNLLKGGDPSAWSYTQRIRLYTFDFALDYDFRNTSKFTPFVGLNVGAALISHKAEAFNGPNSEAKMDSKRSINFMGGFRTGVKYDINSRIALTAFGQYSYLGKLKGRSFDLDPTNHYTTDRAKMHMVEAKLGIRIAF